VPQASIREAARAAAEQREHEARTFTEARTAVNDQLAEVRSSSFERFFDSFFESIQLKRSETLKRNARKTLKRNARKTLFF
jgi:hypothetical protein